MKVSIITVAYNSSATIRDAILSVASQDYENKEHIVIDGGSVDGTWEIIMENQHRLAHFLSEQDRGIYDAMNKGINLADGDVIGFLNADDTYADNRILNDVMYLMATYDLDSVFGDLVYVDQHNPDRIVRYYSSKGFSPKQLSNGIMPAHPTLFFHKNVYKKYGLFKIDYKIAGDFEFVARVFRDPDLRFSYMPKVMINMRSGGVSTKTLRSNWILNKEILKACRENEINTNVLKLLLKYPKKILGLFYKNSYEN